MNGANDTTTKKKSPWVDILSIASSIFSLAGVSFLTVRDQYKLDNRVIIAATATALIGLFFMALLIGLFNWLYSKYMFKGSVLLRAKILYYIITALIVLVGGWFLVSFSKEHVFDYMYRFFSF